MKDELELQTWFEALRAAERRSTPSFEAMWRTASAGSSRSGVPRAIAVGTLALTAASIVLLVHNPAVPAPHEELTRWKSPTESLLRVPDNPITATVPHVRSDVPPHFDGWPVR